jgi:hypothetical protein
LSVFWMLVSEPARSVGFETPAIVGIPPISQVDLSEWSTGY